MTETTGRRAVTAGRAAGLAALVAAAGRLSPRPRGGPPAGPVGPPPRRVCRWRAALPPPLRAVPRSRRCGHGTRTPVPLENLRAVPSRRRELSDGGPAGRGRAPLAIWRHAP